MQGIARIEPRFDGKEILVHRMHEPWGAGQGGGPGVAILVRQPHDMNGSAAKNARCCSGM